MRMRCCTPSFLPCSPVSLTRKSRARNSEKITSEGAGGGKTSDKWLKGYCDLSVSKLSTLGEPRPDLSLVPHTNAIVKNKNSEEIRIRANGMSKVEARRNHDVNS